MLVHFVKSTGRFSRGEKNKQLTNCEKVNFWLLKKVHVHYRKLGDNYCFLNSIKNSGIYIVYVKINELSE